MITINIDSAKLLRAKVTGSQIIKPPNGRPPTQSKRPFPLPSPAGPVGGWPSDAGGSECDEAYDDGPEWPPPPSPPDADHV